MHFFFAAKTPESSRHNSHLPFTSVHIYISPYLVYVYVRVDYFYDSFFFFSCLTLPSQSLPGLYGRTNLLVVFVVVVVVIIVFVLVIEELRVLYKKW